MDIWDAQMEVISELSGCMKPCNYKKYKFYGDSKISLMKSDYFIFTFMAFFNYNTLEKEQLIYPLSSLVGFVHKISTVVFAFASFFNVIFGAGGRVRRNPRPLPWVLLHDYLGRTPVPGEDTLTLFLFLVLIKWCEE